jgi:hypothetical protein
VRNAKGNDEKAKRNRSDFRSEARQPSRGALCAQSAITLPLFALEPPRPARRSTPNRTYPRLREARARGAWLDYGGKLRPPELRMLACEAQVIPIVLGGQGQPLDVRRAKRTPTVSIRGAVQARDQGFAFPGCGRPPAWCDAHHLQHWADGGSTRVDNLVMLCRAHHRLCYHSGWQEPHTRRHARVHTS